MRYISKSRFLSGLQCPKLLWTHYNDKPRIPPPDPSTQAIFDQGRLVGEYAKLLFPDGIEIGAGLVSEFDQIFAQTEEALPLRRPLFEPALSYGNAYARADILNPVGKNEWDLIEVKSTTEVKDIHIDDLAFQRFTFEGAGVTIRNCILMHINREYVRDGEIDPEDLFTMEDVTELVEQRLPTIEQELQEMVHVVESEEEPVITIGPHCDDPYTCSLHDHCWEHVPEHSVFTMSRIGNKKWDLYDSGITDIADIPPDFRLSANQMIQKDAVVSGMERIESSRIRTFLQTLQYPLYFLDFESISPAIPVFDGTRPFQQIPFQFSLHIAEHEGGQLLHHMFLAEGKDDPRPEFMQLLQELLGNTGSIVVYNQGFEKGIMKACTEAMPEYASWYEEIEPRIVDLLVPFRSRDYYHPSQKGSASIKAVLPVLTDMHYDGDIADGTTASNEYLRVTFGEADEEDRMRVRTALEQYCALDTLAMVRIVERLYVLTEYILI
jgi:hypothetical protein